MKAANAAAVYGMEHREEATGYVCKLGVCRDEAEDVVQDALLKSLELDGDIKHGSAYWYRILRSRAVDTHRYRKRLVRFTDEMAETFPSLAPTPLDIIEPNGTHAAAKERLRIALDRLAGYVRTPLQRSAWLKYLSGEGVTVQEGRAVRKIRSRLNNGTRQ